MFLVTMRRYRWLISVAFSVVFLAWGVQGACLERTKKAMWIEPGLKARLNVGKYTFEYNSYITAGNEGTIKILKGDKVLFTDNVGAVGEASWWNPPLKLEPFQMVTVNPTDPPVVLFYSSIGDRDLEVRIYSTIEPKLLDVLHVGYIGATIEYNRGILELHTVHCYCLTSRYGPNDFEYDAIFNINKGKFRLAKGGNNKALFMERAEENWLGFEQRYNHLTKIMQDERLDWSHILWEDHRGEFRIMIECLGKWLANTENSGDLQKIKEAIQKFRNISFLPEEEKTTMLDCLVKAGYDGLAIKE